MNGNEWTRIETPLGGLQIAARDAHTIQVQAGIPHGSEDEEGFAVNGVSYSVQGFYTPYEDGVWREGREADRMSQVYEPRLSRRNTYPGDPTTAALRKAREVLSEVVTEWAAKHPQELLAAESAHRASDRAALVEQIVEHEQAINTLNENIRAVDNGGEYSRYPLSNH